MGSITIQKETTKNPIQLMGMEAGICWNADISDERKNYNRGISCLDSGHGRVAEFPQVYMIIEGYSARVIRELYTHIAGGPTRLQASTRYIDYDNFSYIIPPSIDLDAEKRITYENAMFSVTENMKKLEALGAPREDIANLLPLGMTTKIVLRTNLRNLIDMSHQRECSRAYWEFRVLIKQMKEALSEYSEEWAEIIKREFKPKCELYGYCIEKNSCGRKPKKLENE